MKGWIGMDLSNNKRKKTAQGFTILSGDSTDGHGGFGVGTVSLDNITPIIIDVEAGEAFIDLGALHAKSAIEKRIKFLPYKEEVPNGKPYWIVWVALNRSAEGAYIHGIAASEMTVDQETRRGYKRLPEHVNHMDKALKGKIVVEHMDAKSKQVLRQYFLDTHEDIWNRSSTEIRTSLKTED